MPYNQSLQRTLPHPESVDAIDEYLEEMAAIDKYLRNGCIPAALPSHLKSNANREKRKDWKRKVSKYLI